MEEVNHIRFNAIPHLVEGYLSLIIMEITTIMGGAVKNIFIISKHLAFLKNGYTKLLKVILQINRLFHIFLQKQYHNRR